MTPTDIRDRFIAEAQDIIRKEGWSLPSDAGDYDDLISEISHLTPDPEAYDDPHEYLDALGDDLSLGYAFEDKFDYLKRDVIWTSEIGRIYQDNTGECDSVLLEYYSDLSEAAEGCCSIHDLMTKAVVAWIDREWRGFLVLIDDRLQGVIYEIRDDLDGDE